MDLEDCVLANDGIVISLVDLVTETDIEDLRHCSYRD